MDEEKLWKEILDAAKEIHAACDLYFENTGDGDKAAIMRQHAIRLENAAPVDVRAKHFANRKVRILL